MSITKKAKWDAADVAAKAMMECVRKGMGEDVLDNDLSDKEYDLEQNKQIRRILISLIDRLSCAGYKRHYLSEFEEVERYNEIW